MKLAVFTLLIIAWCKIVIEKQTCFYGEELQLLGIARWKPNVAACLMIVSCFAYSSTLKMNAIYSSRTSVGFQLIALRYIPEDGTDHEYRYLKSCMFSEGNSVKASQILQKLLAGVHFSATLLLGSKTRSNAKLLISSVFQIVVPFERNLRVQIFKYLTSCGFSEQTRASQDCSSDQPGSSDSTFDSHLECRPRHRDDSLLRKHWVRSSLHDWNCKR
jgi:hypothetical protein